LTGVSTNRSFVRDQVERHPLLAFVALAYAISWASWLLMRFVDAGAFSGVGIIASAGPALAAVIVSAILRPNRSGISAANHWALFGAAGTSVLALLVLRRYWLAQGLVTVSGRPGSPVIYPALPAFLLDVLAAAAVAVVLSGAHSTRQGTRDLLRSLDPRRQSARWYWFVIAAGVYPAIVALGNVISVGVGLPASAPRASGEWYWLAVDVILVFLAVMVGGGGLEEPGWRGFALPCLEKRYSPLRSSLIVAVIWAFWHWPLFWLGYYGGGPLGVFSYVLGCIPVAILFTAVFHWTKSSLPVVILLHTSINVTPIFLPATMIASGLWWLLMLCVAAGMLFFRKNSFSPFRVWPNVAQE